MKKIIEILKSSDYVVAQLAYSSKQYKGKLTAIGARETLFSELDNIELRINDLESSTSKDLILLNLKYLKICLNEMKIENDYEAFPLNYILQEYFIHAREKLKDQLSEIEN